MRMIEIGYPETIPAILNQSPEVFEQEARFALAVKLYEMGRLTSGQAARLAGVSRVLASVIEKAGHSMGLRPPAIRAMIDKYTEDIAVDGSLIQKELGFVPQYDLKTGWEETIKEMRRENSLTF